MAKCKICKKNIPDGTEYCKDCLDKEKTKANESYLDSLLSSVKNTTPTTDNIYNKKKLNSNADITSPNASKVSEPDSKNDDFFKYDLGDIEDFDQYNINEDLDELKDDEIISDEKLFGEDLSEIFSFADTSKEKDKNTVNREDKITESPADKIKNINNDNVSAGIKNTEGNAEDIKSENTIVSVNTEDSLKKSNTENTENIEKNSDLSDLAVSDRKEKTSDVITANNVSTNENNDYNEENSYDTDLNDLLNQLDNVHDNKESDEVKNISTGKNEEEVKDSIKTESINNEKAADISASKPEEEDDFLSLLNQISDDDPVSDDVKAINDLMNGVAPEPPIKTNMPSDVGEVFSDALKAVSNLNDPNINESELLNQIPEKKSKKAKKKKKDKKKKGKADNNQEDGSAGEKPKKGLFKRLFGNVEDKNASKKGAKANKPVNGESNEIIEIAKTDKPKKGKKGKKGKASDENNALDNGKMDKEKSGKEASEDKKGKQKGKKKEKKPKKQKSNEVIQVIDELDEDVGRINRLGATIVFVFFALLALLIYAGSNAVSYTLGIQHATSYFAEKEYTQAYDEVDGMNIKDEDIEIYRKILTVMFVNKQLNSYNNYCTLGEYPQALDSLLKGLKRYDKYIKAASLLGIKTDMNYVRNQILAELKHQFNLSEADAFNIISIDNMKEYSLKVYDVASQNE